MSTVTENIELYNVYNFEIKNNTPDQAEITDTPPMSQDFPSVLPGNGQSAKAQAASGLGISGSFTIAFSKVKFVCTYSFEWGSEPKFNYITEGQDPQLYEIFPQPVPASVERVANVFINIKQWIPV